MDVLIIGAGGHGRVVLDILRAAGEHAVAGFIDADPARAGDEVGGVRVLGGINQLPRLLREHRGRLGAVVAIGDGAVRRSYGQVAADAGLELIRAVHPAAVVSESATLGVNVVVAAGAIICADARVGDHVLINTGAIVDHECQIGGAVHICPGSILAGRVEVGEEAFVGMGAKVLPCMKIGARAIVGAGAVVREDVPEATTVVGVPARRLAR